MAVLKKCAQCDMAYRYIQLPGTGRLWVCTDCSRVVRGNSVYRLQEQVVVEEVAAKKAAFKQQERRQSSKPCPECHRPMWAVREEGYGVRHQCDNCRLTVLFGGAVQRWRGAAKPAEEPT